MKKTERHAPRAIWQRSMLSLAVSAAAVLSFPMTAQAVQFDLADGEITGSLDTTLSYGSLWRVTGPDKTNLGPLHGGTKPNTNYDNGDLSYKRGEQVSSLFKMTNDIDLNYQNFGAFVRINSFYDHAINSKSFNENRVDNRTVRDRIGHDYEVLDAYVRGKFQVAGKSLDVRAGKQVVSWGESTFIPNGINAINPVDVAKLRAPGSELKEAFLPVNMLWLSQEITDNLSVEVFNQFEYKKTRLDPNGGYFSTNDFLSPGGRYISISPAQDQFGSPANLPRGKDNTARDSGQYGLAVRLLVPELNNTEFGLYYINYHSRTPFVSGRTTSDTTGAGEAAIQAAIMANPAIPPAGKLAAITAAVSANRAQNSLYWADYPEDIALYGLSFSTPGPLGIALQGEYSYRPNMPVQIAATDLLNGLVSLNVPPAGPFANGEGALPRNTAYEGYKSVKFHQAQLTGTKSFGPQIKADQVVAVAELGYTYMDLPSEINGNPIAFNGNSLDHVVKFTPNRKGAATKQSYGYRVVARADYNNALGAINLSPRIAFAHDLRGVSPTFNQGVQAATVGIGASYQNSWQADLAYTNYFGGETYRSAGGTTSNNMLSDRDFIAATVSYSF